MERTEGRRYCRMHIVTPICIFFVRRAVRSSLCVMPARRPADARSKPSLYHSKVNAASSILKFYTPFIFTLCTLCGKAPEKLRGFVQAVKKPMLLRKDSRAAGELEGAKAPLEIRL